MHSRIVSRNIVIQVVGAADAEFKVGTGLKLVEDSSF